MTTEIETPASQIAAPEIPRSGWDTLIILQRHGRYDTGYSRTRGSLTEEGRLEAKERADERIEAILSQFPEKTDFLILHSPTHERYDENNRPSGQRAKETAEIIAEEVLTALKERGLPEDQLLNRSDRFKGELSRPEHRIAESITFPLPEFAKVVRKEYGSKYDRDTLYDEDKLDKLSFQLNRERPAADMANRTVNTVARFARGFHHQHPDRKLVVWMVSHGTVFPAYTNTVLHIPKDKLEWDYNDGISIAIDSQGNAKTKIEGVEYQIPLAAHGKPALVQSNQKND